MAKYCRGYIFAAHCIWERLVLDEKRRHGITLVCTKKKDKLAPMINVYECS